MNRFNKFLVAAFMSAAMLLANIVQAMDIQQFEKMGDSRGPYIADLVQAAEQSLKDAGRADDAEQVAQLFTTNAPNSNNSIGANQFYATLAIAFDAAAKNPNAPPIDVSKVLAVCLEKNDHIKLPEEFMQLATNLDQKYSPNGKKENKDKKEKKN